MSKCRAGDCEIECGGGRGCGCIAESDTPANCKCYCPGGDITGDMTLDATTVVNVSTNELPLFEVATFFNALHKETIVVPVDRMREPVSLNVDRKSFGDVLNQLGLTTRESLERGKRKIAWLAFLAGLGTGAIIVSLVV